MAGSFEVVRFITGDKTHVRESGQTEPLCGYYPQQSREPYLCPVDELPRCKSCELKLEAEYPGVEWPT